MYSIHSPPRYVNRWVLKVRKGGYEIPAKFVNIFVNYKLTFIVSKGTEVDSKPGKSSYSIIHVKSVQSKNTFRGKTKNPHPIF